MRLTLGLLALICFSSLLTPGHTTTAAAPAGSNQGSYMLQQLQRLTADYWARVAGRDTGLPPHVNGHDEFAAAWTREILANLHGLPTGVFRRPFAAPGFRDLSPQRSGMNVVVAVPGSRYPQQAVVVGAHYDGEPSSKGSAYDDASGCVIMLALSRLLGDIWRAHGLPSLTVEFVLFDAEEQGLDGSEAFSYDDLHGALMPRPVLMINEEQSGVDYPVRPFGLRSQNPIPSLALISGQVPGFLSRILGPIRQPNQAALSLLNRRLRDARSSVFRTLHSVYPSLHYRGGSAAAFTGADQRYLQITSFSICCSDNDPFDAIGVPTVTFSGDFTFYERNAPSWAYPFDQPQDTLQTLACDASGSPQPGAALQAALELPLRMSRTLISAYAPPSKESGITLFSTLPAAQQPIRFQLVGSRNGQWSFGDGTHAAGAQMQHVYARPGTYRLTVRSGKLTQSWRVVVPATQQDFRDPIRPGPPPRIKPWHPAELQGISGCQ